MNQNRQTFDVAICEELRKAAISVLAKYPEARSIAAMVDYHGGLNDADINKGIWLGENGNNKSFVEVFGGLFQTLRLLEGQLSLASKMIENLREQAEVIGSEVVKKSEELKKIDEAIQSRRTQPTAAAGTPEEAEA